MFMVHELSTLGVITYSALIGFKILVFAEAIIANGFSHGIFKQIIQMARFSNGRSR